MSTVTIVIHKGGQPIAGATSRAMSQLHGLAFERAWSPEEFASLLSHPGATAIACADENGGLLAFAIGRIAADEAEVITIVTHPTARQRGIARRLMTELECVATAQGAVTQFLEVAEDNVAARALYDRLGFSEAGRRRRYYPREDDDPVDALILRKPLHTVVDGVAASTYNRP